MAIGTEQVAALRAMLAGEFDEHARLTEQLDRNNGWASYSTLLAAAFFEAVDRRFGSGHTSAEVIQLVADARARFDESGTAIDPRAAERLVLSALGEGNVDDLDDRTVAGTETVLVAALVAEQRFDSAALDAFVEEARRLAVGWENG